jgi:8-oxo-dGTP diphosphatase
MRALLYADVLRELSDARERSMTAPVVDVVAGIIRDERGRYLITQRRKGTHLAGLWEFPGGKREADETLEASLRRELHEELGGRFYIGALIETVRWTYPEKIVVLSFFQCRLEEGSIEPREGQLMRWVPPLDLRRYDFPPADAALLTRLAAGG